MLKTLRRFEGLSLIELLVTVAVLAIVAAIAFPVVAGQQQTGNKAVAIADGAAWSMTLTSELRDQVNFGLPGTIAVDPQSQLMTVTLTGATPDAPFPLEFPVNVSEGTSMTAGSIAGSSWCFVVDNGGQSVVYTETGLKKNATGCSEVGVAQ